jgi:multidrug efflux system membrane fusion protein
MKSSFSLSAPACVFAAAVASLAWVSATALAAEPSPGAALKTYTVQPGTSGEASSVDGVVEALRQTVLAAQVSGNIVQLNVRVGDAVKAGQVLMRIDARAAEQTAQASEAQAQSARAALHLASREFQRQQQLFKQQYISQAALDQAEAQFKSTQAQVNAQLAQLDVARTQSSFNLVRSPYDGVVSEVPVALGDMAMPGRALATVYDPSALRVTAPVPQSLAQGLHNDAELKLQIPGLGAAGSVIKPQRVQLLPTVDASSHTWQLRLDLPSRLAGAVPGMFARVMLPAALKPSSSALSVPRSALVRRAEFDGLYVLNAKGQALLRQVRLGSQQGDLVEVLSGLSAGERVALDPQAAARKP